MKTKNCKIYLDHAAATYLDPKVLNKMLPYLKTSYANASGVYQFAQKNRIAIDEARKIIAQVINSKPDEVFFTGSGSESNNFAIFGSAYCTSNAHLITTKIEHHSVLHPVQELQRRGFKVTFLSTDKYGRINLEELKKALQPNTKLVSIAYANNEIGTIENIQGISKILKNTNIFFHTDACQAAGSLSLDVKILGVDLMTINSGKIYGPKGVGALYIKEGIKITPLIYGGGQEHRMRAGTENVAGIVGFAEALKISEQMRKKESLRLIKLRDLFIKKLKSLGAKLNGDPLNRLPNNINVTFPNMDAESLLLRLDMEGICASSGSACTSGSLEESHVLTGIGLSKKDAKSSLRFTLGRKTTEKEIKTVIKILQSFI